MLHFFHVALCDVVLFWRWIVWCWTFNFALVFAALSNVVLFHHFTIQRCNVLILHYYFDIVLFNATLDECCMFLFYTIDIALLMPQVVLAITLLVIFCIFGSALLHSFKVSQFNNCIDSCTSSCYFFIIELCNVAF